MWCRLELLQALGSAHYARGADDVDGFMVFSSHELTNFAHLDDIHDPVFISCLILVRVGPRTCAGSYVVVKIQQIGVSVL